MVQSLGLQLANNKAKSAEEKKKAKTELRENFFSF